MAVNTIVSFSQTTSGQHTIYTVEDGNRVTFDVGRMSKGELGELVNGLANIMSTVACYLQSHP